MYAPASSTTTNASRFWSDALVSSFIFLTRSLARVPCVVHTRIAKICLYINMCVCVCMYVCIYICIYIYIYMCISRVNPDQVARQGALYNTEKESEHKEGVGGALCA